MENFLLQLILFTIISQSNFLGICVFVSRSRPRPINWPNDTSHHAITIQHRHVDTIHLGLMVTSYYNICINMYVTEGDEEKSLQ